MGNILIVDDDPMNLKVAKFILESGGHQTNTVSSASECFDFLMKNTVDLILLDIEMPVLNGIKTLEYLREQERYRNIPVVFLTAEADVETVTEAARLGAQGYVKKPFLPKDLLDRVEQVMIKS